MAVFKLGSIVTDITGSIGGTTFVRGSQSIYMQNKSRGASRSQLFKNIQLPAIASIFQKWNALTQLLRDDWNLVALDYQFPDKFGVLRNLTGRQLFTKLNIQLIPVGSYNDQADQVNSIVQEVTIDNFNIQTDLANAEIQYTLGSTESYILCQIEVSKNLIQAPIFSRRKITAFAYVSDAGGFDVISELLAQFPYIDSTYNVRAFLTPMNDWGFKGTTIYKDAVWLA